MTTELYLNLLQDVLLDTIYGCYIADAHGNSTQKLAQETETENGSIWPMRAHTMIGKKRLQNIKFCLEDVLKNNIEGDCIETGVWRGGACIFMKGILKVHNNTDKKIFVADSFEGLPPPDPKYTADNGDSHHKIKYLAVSKEEVEKNFKSYNLLDENVIFIKGFFEHSIPKAPITKLSILRLDGDMYSSTIQVLDALYQKLSVGGYCIIDDYGLAGCKAAVDDFRRDHNITEPLIYIDYYGRFWQKLRE